MLYSNNAAEHNNNSSNNYYPALENVCQLGYELGELLLGLMCKRSPGRRRPRNGWTSFRKWLIEWQNKAVNTTTENWLAVTWCQAGGKFSAKQILQMCVCIGGFGFPDLQSSVVGYYVMKGHYGITTSLKSSTEALANNFASSFTTPSPLLFVSCSSMQHEEQTTVLFRV